jgi:hypothetical protein
MRTHEDEDSLSIPLPAFGPFIIVFLRNLRINSKEWPRAIAEGGFRLRWLI